MAASALVDAGFVIALLSRRDRHHKWAVAQSSGLPPPWKTCDAVLSEAFHLPGPRGRPALSALHRRGADIPMSLADACLVRMSETLADPIILTTDADFRIYRRHGRQVVPCMTPR